MLKLFIAKEIVKDLKELGHSLDSDYEIILNCRKIPLGTLAGPNEDEFVSNSLDDVLEQAVKYLRKE